MNPADHDSAEEIAVVEGGDLKLQGLLGVANRGRNVAKDGIEERTHVVALGCHVGLGVATHATTKEVGKVALIVVGTQLQEQIQNLVDGLLRINAGAVDLVDENDRTQALLERLLQHETGLGHRPLVGVHDQQTAVDHAEHALHFATEVSVTRGVNDVDPDPFEVHRSVLGEDRDTPLTLQIVGVHHAGGDGLVVAEDARLGQQGIHQGGFAVVDVGNDRDIADRCSGMLAAHGWGSREEVRDGLAGARRS